ncbi:MAG: sigma-70 family RNA polymerase sigma factor [Acidimicrobiales bacterium]
MTATSLGVIGGLAMLAPLSVEEERQLYPVIERGREAERLLGLTRTIDASERRRLLRDRQAGQEAESLLLRATCGLVRTRVLERGYRFGNEDLEAAGIEGLVNALQRFDPSKGNRFSTYANYWIMKLVNQAIQQQAGLSDSEMRRVLAFQKLQRSQGDKRLTKRDVALALGISQAKALEVMQTSRDLNARRFEPTDFNLVGDLREPVAAGDAPTWVIDELRTLCGKDFDAFWQYTFRTMSIEEIAKGYGISRQAMSKRLDRCRKAVIESPEASRLRAWFIQQ